MKSQKISPGVVRFNPDLYVNTSSRFLDANYNPGQKLPEKSEKVKTHIWNEIKKPPSPKFSVGYPWNWVAVSTLKLGAGRGNYNDLSGYILARIVALWWFLFFFVANIILNPFLPNFFVRLLCFLRTSSWYTNLTVDL